MQITKNDFLFYTALITAIWFAFTGIVWVYWGALFIAYPFGIISLIIWRKFLLNENKKRTKLIPAILLLGLVLSLSVLLCLLIWG